MRNLQGQSVRGAAFWVVSLLAFHPALLAAETKPTWQWPEPFRRDANLYAVSFLNPRVGWAVGDRGTILHTRDGGETWDLQPAPTVGRLESICFVGGEDGWIVGAKTIPFTHRSRGIVLRTSDAGETWNEDQSLLPGLRGVHFFNEQQGVTYGDPSAMYPSGVFCTQDGGAHWKPLTGQSKGWVHGSFQSASQGALLDRRGNLFEISNTNITAGPRVSDGPQLAFRLLELPNGRRIACGNQGLVSIGDGTPSVWQPISKPPENLPLTEFDWHAVDVVGNRIWIAGAPGTRILHSADSGSTWQVFDTGQTLPIHSIDFVDETHGWAVGGLGTILATSDGGRTWKPQHGNGKRLATLAVFGRPSEICWELVAQLAASDQYHVGVEVLAMEPTMLDRPHTTPAATRIHEATTQLGGVGAHLIQGLQVDDHQLLPTADQIRATWNADGPDTVRHLTEYLTRQLRIWKPEVVITPGPVNPRDGMTDLVRQITLQATEIANDAQQFPQQAQAGLTPWRVSRVTTFATAQGHGYAITGGRMVVPFGRTVTQLADRARCLVLQQPTAGLPDVYIRTSGTDEGYGILPTTTKSMQEIRRPRTDLPYDLEKQTKSIQRRRSLEVLLKTTKPAEPAIWQQAMHLAGELNEDHRGELFFACASHSLSYGQSTAGFQHLHEVAWQLPNHEWSEAARIHLFWYLASQEASMHWPLPTNLKSKASQEGGRIIEHQGRVVPAAFFDSNASPPEPPQDSDPISPNPDLHERDSLLQKTIRRIQTQQPDLYFEPLFRYPLAAYQRRTNQLDDALQFWKSQLSGRTPAAFRSWAASEVAINQTEGIPAKPVWSCPRVQKRPRLDGQLEDDIWREAGTISLRTTKQAKRDTATSMFIAYDAEYLYLAARCPKFSELSYLEAESGRQRDQDPDVDHIQICLDVDRDGVTSWRLTIDFRGWATDRLNNDLTWNPTWFIAQHHDASTWQVEAAIPLTQLTTDLPKPGVHWCVGVQRIAPTVDWQTWLQPAPIEAHPEEFGLLEFQ